MIRSQTTRVRRALRGAALVALSALTLGACDDETPPPFEVVGEGTISGLLFFDVERDGVFEPIEGDSALAGVPLSLRVRGTGDVISGTETTTDAEGRFTITNVPVGTHDLVFSEEFLEGVAVVCNSPREVSVRISEVTSSVISSQESCLIPIAEARAQELGSPLTIRGVVTVGTGGLSGSYYFVQDETAGIKVQQSGSAALGDFVEVSGVLGEAFVERMVINGSTTVLGTGTVPDPVVLTGEQLLSHEWQGSVVTVEGVEVTDIVINVGGGDNITVLAPDGEVFLIRNDYDAGVAAGTFQVGNVYDVTGPSSPFGGAEQIYVRSQADVVPVP